MAGPINFTDLQVFRAVVEEGGIVKAARKLHRVPSNVTKRIKQLESSMGVTLFHRDRQRCTCSDRRIAAGYADRLVQLSEEARAAVSLEPGEAASAGALEHAASRFSACWWFSIVNILMFV
jgi:DNA-binding transcriptional LysR family regulator